VIRFTLQIHPIDAVSVNFTFEASAHKLNVFGITITVFSPASNYPASVHDLSHLLTEISINSYVTLLIGKPVYLSIAFKAKSREKTRLERNTQAFN
jgi:hypothetical protein